MLILTKAVLAMMIGFIFSAVLGLIIIPFLKKFNFKQKILKELQQHSTKEGTPTMGGIIFIVPALLTTVILLLMDRIEFSFNLLIVLFVFIAYAILGFIDDYLKIKRKHNDGLLGRQKLLGQLLIASIFFYIFISSGSDPILHIHTLGIKLNLGIFYYVLILLILVGFSNAVNITDGLDGLAGGLSLITFASFGMIAWSSFWVAGNEDIAIFAFILVGCLTGFLLFNTYPAKVFMGDTGSLALGATLASIAIITSHEITLIIVAGVFVIVTLSVIIQIASIKCFNKKVFLMAPLHHHFEKLGWHETDIVKLFWSVGLILSMAAIVFGVWI